MGCMMVVTLGLVVLVVVAYGLTLMGAFMLGRRIAKAYGRASWGP